MYGTFYRCKHCHKKGAYIFLRYLAGPPDYFMKCRYCKETWEGITDELREDRNAQS